MLTRHGVDKIPLCSVCQAEDIEKIKQANHKNMCNLFEAESLPRRYWDASRFTDGMDKESKELLDKFKKGIYFYGESGVGKTYQLAGWFKYAIMQGKTVKWIDWSDWLCELKANLNEYQPIRTKYSNAECIFLDGFDVGGQYVADYTFNFLNYLYKNDKIVYVSSESLVWQDRFASRLAEMTIQYELVGKNGNN
jgi:DNA replication protein DnaC